MTTKTAGLSAELRQAVERMQRAGDNIEVGLGWHEAADLVRLGVEEACRVLGDDLGRYEDANGIRKLFGLRPVRYVKRAHP